MINKTTMPKIQLALRTTAEKDPNDIIANSASALAVKLETFGTNFGTTLSDITDTDYKLIDYAVTRLDTVYTRLRLVKA